jgi:D-3-phosphoglycerate dehydrogenase
MKIVITDHRFPELQQEQRALDRAAGTLIVAQTTDEEQLARACRDAEGVLNARAQITRPAIGAMERCRIIVRYGIGVDTIDIAAATERGIMVANVPDYCVDEVSDHALTLLLMLSRQMVAAFSLAKEDGWTLAKMPQLHRLRDQTCGLLGCGQIGSLLAGKVSALGMRVLVCDPYLSEERAREMGAEPVPFNTLLECSDFISLHAPLNVKT